MTIRTAILAVCFVLGGLMLIFGLVLLGFKASFGEPVVVEGRVTFAEVRSKRDSDGHTSYSILVDYDYEREGRSYKNRSVAPVSMKTYPSGWTYNTIMREQY